MFGPKELNPPNRWPKLWEAIPGLHQHLTMVIGEPYLSDEVWEWRKNGEQFRRANPALWVMANIANTSPSGVRAEELKEYRDVLVSFRPDRNRIVLAAA